MSFQSSAAAEGVPTAPAEEYQQLCMLPSQFDGCGQQSLTPCPPGHVVHVENAHVGGIGTLYSGVRLVQVQAAPERLAPRPAGQVSAALLHDELPGGVH